MKINRKQFIAILEAVKPGLASRELIEHSTSFMFDGGQVLTYNDEVSVRHKLGKEYKDLDGTAIQAKELIDLLNKMSDEELELEVLEAELRVQSKKAQAGIKMSAANTKDLIAALGTPKDWESLPASFIPALEFCIFSTSTDLTKPELTCICVDGNYAIASDNIRLASYNLGRGVSIKKMLIPARAANELFSYEPTEYSLSEEWIHFKNDHGVIFSCRVIASEYQTEKALGILEQIEGQIAKFPDGVSDALERAGIFSKGDSKLATDDRVKITVDEGLLTVYGEGSSGWFKEASRIRYKGDFLEFEINPKHLSLILSHVNDVIVGDKALKFEGDNFQYAVSTLSVRN